MVKIKKEVEMNLAEIIDWGWKTPSLSYGKLYKKDDKEFGDYVSFDHQTNEVRVSGKIDCDDLFTVTTEEEITEDTKLEKAIEVYIDDSFGWKANGWKGQSIKDILATNQDDTRTETIHLINDDGTHTLIWRDGKLVE